MSRWENCSNSAETESLSWVSRSYLICLKSAVSAIVAGGGAKGKELAKSAGIPDNPDSISDLEFGKLAYQWAFRAAPEELMIARHSILGLIPCDSGFVVVIRSQAPPPQLDPQGTLAGVDRPDAISIVCEGSRLCVEDGRELDRFAAVWRRKCNPVGHEIPKSKTEQ